MIFLWLLSSCMERTEGNKVVLCFPVYGQSLALGEEAERITDFDSLSIYADGRIVTEHLNHSFGYFESNSIKAFAKKVVGYRKRAFELSVYNMAKILADHIGSDTLICIFPGGQGATVIANLSKGTAPYTKFIDDISTAYNEAHSRGWTFCIPAICWMQGESDIVDYPHTDYQQMLRKIWSDMNADILSITHQQDSIPFICYQPNALSRASHFHADSYQCPETQVPQAFVNLLRDDQWFWASGPTYPYSCVDDKIHIDAQGQQAIGALAAQSVLDILRKERRQAGLIPTAIKTEGNSVTIHFNIPNPPLSFDTLQVSKAHHYGFSIICKDNRDIVDTVMIAHNATTDTDVIKIQCSESPVDCFVRYAVNGSPMKSGRLHGPRGNLRDQKHWCYQFNLPCR